MATIFNESEIAAEPAERGAARQHLLTDARVPADCMITVRLPPPRLPGGIKGSTSLHSSSVKSLGYRNLLRS
jgi:hypothetical protein